MEERQSRLSSMVWRRLRPYFCVLLIPQNSMFSNFCHVLKNSDIYVQTSRYEGYGLSIAEARLLGVPVVTTPYDCVALQIKGGINGIISTFDPNDIADSIATLIDNKTLYASVKSNLTNDIIGNLTEFTKIERLIDYED